MTGRLPLVLVLLLSAALPTFAATSDLLLSAYYPIRRVMGGTRVEIRLTAFNQGPDATSDSTISLDLPPGFHAAFTPANCTGENPIRCSTGGMAYPGSAAVEITVETPLQPVTAELHATVTSSNADPNPADNEFRAPIAVVDLPNVTLRFETDIKLRTVDPGQTFNTFLLISNLPPAQPADVRVQFDVANAEITNITSAGWICGLAGSDGWACTNHSFSGSWGFPIALRVGPERDGGKVLIVAKATTLVPDFNEGDNLASTSLPRNRWYGVTTTADSGDGSLRAAIDAANAGCVSDPCKIVFEIPAPVPPDGWFTIEPLTPLPAISASHVIVDGTRQTAVTGDTNANGPEVALDGRLTAGGDGLSFLKACDAGVLALAIGNFRQFGIGFYQAPATCVVAPLVSDSYIGVDASGTLPMPNLRGVWIDGTRSVGLDRNVIANNVRSGVWVTNGSASITRNRIESNGASGVFAGAGTLACDITSNTIAGNGEMGVAVARDAQRVWVSQNSMRSNGGLGIDIGLDGPNPPRADDSGPGQGNPPAILSAKYDPVAGTTTVTGTLRSGDVSSYSNVFQVELFGNDAPDGDGEEFAGYDYGVHADGRTFVIFIKKNLEGKWINATATRTHFVAAKPDGYAGGESWTSELSNAVKVEW